MSRELVISLNGGFVRRTRAGRRHGNGRLSFWQENSAAENFATDPANSRCRSTPKSVITGKLSQKRDDGILHQGARRFGNKPNLSAAAD